MTRDEPQWPRPELTIWTDPAQELAQRRRTELPANGEWVLGISEDCDIVLDEDDDVWASRRHAAITTRAGIAEIRDLGSKTGTTVNDELIDTTTVLQDGDLVKVGRTSLRVSLPLLRGLATPDPPKTRAPRLVPFAAERAAVLRVDSRVHGRWVDHTREALNEMVGRELGCSAEHARRRLDQFARYRGVTGEVGRRRLQALANDIAERPFTPERPE